MGRGLVHPIKRADEAATKVDGINPRQMGWQEDLVSCDISTLFRSWPFGPPRGLCGQAWEVKSCGRLF